MKSIRRFFRAVPFFSCGIYLGIKLEGLILMQGQLLRLERLQMGNQSRKLPFIVVTFLLFV